MKKPSLNRLVELHKLLLAFQEIERHVCYVTPLSSGRSENDAEHSYSLAMTAWFLCEYFPKLDTNKVIRIALAHDLVEIYSGDTSVFADAEKLASKPSRENAALGKLVDEWHDFPELAEAMHAYKTRSTEEAKFVYALDKLMPLLLNVISDGHGWRKHEITLDRIHSLKKDKMKTHPVINEYYRELYELFVQHPEYFHHEPATRTSQQR